MKHFITHPLGRLQANLTFLLLLLVSLVLPGFARIPLNLGTIAAFTAHQELCRQHDGIQVSMHRHTNFYAWLTLFCVAAALPAIFTKPSIEWARAFTDTVLTAVVYFGAWVVPIWVVRLGNRSNGHQRKEP